MKARHAKSYAREKAMKKTYSNLINLKIDRNQELNVSDPLADKIALGVEEHKEVIDNYIKKNLKKWSFNELNSVNLAILEVGIWEILYEETEVNIVISEALTIAQVYTDQKSKNFIHFVLDNVKSELSGQTK